MAGEPAAARTDPIYVMYGTRQVKARIDPGVPLSEIVRQLVGSRQLGIVVQQHGHGQPGEQQFVLREKESGQLVTDDNVEELISASKYFYLGPAPTVEAAEMVDKLGSDDKAVIKRTVFALRSLVKERGTFIDEFISQRGLDALQNVVLSSSANTLAYALVSLQNLMELEERGWQGIHDPFVSRLIHIVANEPLLNVVRPATTLLRRLVTLPVDSAGALGYSRVSPEISQTPAFLPQVVSRLSSSDVATASATLALVNSLFKGANEEGLIHFGGELERLGAIKTIADQVDAAKADQPYALAFQVHYAHFLFLLQQTPLSSLHNELFGSIANSAALPRDDAALGYASSQPQDSYDESGYLGLKTWHRFSQSSEFSKTVKEQLGRAEDRRCPVAAASNAVVLLLARQFEIDSPSPLTRSAVPLLRFYDLHDAVFSLFKRMWSESGALAGDFDRVLSLSSSALMHVLDETTTWAQLVQGLETLTYDKAREQELESLEARDQYERHPGVRQLKNRLFNESLAFMKEQRIQCLLDGAWFKVAPKAAAPKKQTQVPKWRFYRLSSDRRTLHWCEAKEPFDVKPGLEDLSDKLEVALISNVSTKAAVSDAQQPERPFSPSTAVTRNSISQISTSTVIATTPAQALAFTISAADDAYVELVAPDSTVLSEWVDGLSVLRQQQQAPDPSLSLQRTPSKTPFAHPTTTSTGATAAAAHPITANASSMLSMTQTAETAQYASALADMALKVKLLDLTGDQIEMPAPSANAYRSSVWHTGQASNKQAAGPLPPIHTAPFWYADDI